MPASHNERPVFLHARWIAKVALAVATLALSGLLLSLFWVIDDRGGSYASTIFSHNLTRQSLAPTILVFGLVMTVVASVVTWFFALYSSFRVAGPLFRFSQNLKSIIGNAFAVPIAIRQTDMLQREWLEFETSQSQLREHYRGLRDGLDRFDQSLQSPNGFDSPASQAAWAALQEVERRAQL
jgi:hypothetical protein